MLDKREFALHLIQEFVVRVRLGEYSMEGSMPGTIVEAIATLAEGVIPPAKLPIPEIGITLFLLAPDDRRMIIHA